MAVKYCDYASGSDTTGDGSAGNPYKTIDKASTGLTGGDEVRCAKSAAPTQIGGTGNWQWTDGGTTVTISGDYSTAVAAKDFIGKNVANTTWWEVSSVAYAGGTTTITLVATYSGTTEAVATYKLGVTDTGAAAALGTNVQLVSASGTSVSSRLKVSGGWNLSGTPAQDGYTWFWQSGSSKYGVGLYGNVKNFIEIDGDRVGFLRYYRGLYLYTSAVARQDGWLITDLSCLGCNLHNLDLEECVADVQGGWFCGNVGTSGGGIFVSGSALITVSGVQVRSNYRGFYITGAHSDVLVYNSQFHRNSSATLRPFNNGGHVVFEDCALANAPVGVYAYANVGTIVLCNCTLASVTTPFNTAADNVGQWPCVRWQHYNGTADDNRIDFVYGSAKRDTADARSGACWKLQPTDGTQRISTWRVLRTYAAASADKELAIYLKRSGTYTAGDVELAAYNEAGRLVAGPTAQTVGTGYGRHTITIAAADLPRAQVVELRVLAKRQAGTDLAVYADDFMAA